MSELVVTIGALKRRYGVTIRIRTRGSMYMLDVVDRNLDTTSHYTGSSLAEVVTRSYLDLAGEYGPIAA